jgi:hypothetical protein
MCRCCCRRRFFAVAKTEADKTLRLLLHTEIGRPTFMTLRGRRAAT